MRKTLHILTEPGNALAEEILRQQTALPELLVEITDLAAAEPDYGRLLEQIFAADSIAVW